MNAETQIAALEVEQAHVRAAVAVAHETIATLSVLVTAVLERVKEVEEQQVTDSHTSSTPSIERRATARAAQPAGDEWQESG